MKKIAIVLVLCLVAVATFAQTKQTLAILPFTGGNSGDGETIAELFSFDQTLNSAFTPIPRTSINAAIQKEQNFQMASGMTNPETISRIGKQLGAKYIVAGSITQLGSKQLLVIAIMQIENLQQIAGEWLTYQNISEVRGKLPDMAKNIAAASRNDTSRLQRLAVLPLQMASGDREADTLAQILSIEIIRAGVYAVFPRTKTLEQVQAEYKTQTSGITDDYSIVAIGRGENPLLALSGTARKLGNDRMFNAAVINVENGTQLKGGSADYKVIEDGIGAMYTLARSLISGVTVTASDFTAFNYDSLMTAIDSINNQGTGNYTITLTDDITFGLYDTPILLNNNAQKTITFQGDNTVRSLISQHFEYPVFLIPIGLTIVLGKNININATTNGVGIYGGSLRMENGAKISLCRGHGVYIYGGGTFTMNGGTIAFNSSSGVYVEGHGTFTMNDGSIDNNSTEERGGGVYVDSNGTFVKTGGTITNNIAKMKNGGNAVYAGNKKRRNSAAGPSVKMDSGKSGKAGGWE